MIRALCWCFTAILIGVGLPTPALASENDSGGFRISVRVPEVCDVSANDFILDSERGMIVGEVMESCNHTRGFQIFASHRPLEDSEQVDVRYGGSLANLGRSGLSPITFRSGVRHGLVPVAISAAGLTEALHLSFSVTAV